MPRFSRALVVYVSGLTAIAGAAALAAVPASGDKVFGLTKRHQVSVTIPAAEWTVLQTSSARGGTGIGGADYTAPDGRIIHTGSGFRGFFPWVHADMRLDGTEFKNVGLRYKGNLSFSSSSAAAPFRANLKVKLDLFEPKADWDGLETLNFHAGVVEPSLMREAIAYSIFRAAGVPASRTAYAELTFTVPGLHDNARGGLYVLIENVNKQFLKDGLPPGTGLLMKPEGLRGGVQSYGDAWEPYVAAFRPDRDATPHEQQRVIEFAKLVSQTDVAAFRSRIGSYLDVDGFLRYLAVNAFLGNWDSYINGGHNFYLYLDPNDDRIRFIPWDEDLSLGSRGNSVIDIARPLRNENPLIYWLLDDPAVTGRYRAILKELSLTAFSRAEIMKTVDALEQAVGTKAGPVRDFIEARISSLQQVVGAKP